MSPFPAKHNASEPKEVIRLSVSEAAKLFGVSPLTVRRAIAAKEITYAVVGGRYKISFESLVKWSQRHTTVRNKTASRGIGQYVDKWKIKNTLFSPNPKIIKTEDKLKTDDPTAFTNTPEITQQ
ncbi:MAG: hypothetical protein A2538_04590 [Candidatus Magasanikbacteria bacterium RIFOXYD2_FULL_41_14]|uniref:Helix-turn-helix domain-containing protein n=1 Tax=Candidatus Magasanikbacteria bacterium RIFOXYD2_FULL_41_14 TaxID=1798709 RepID=A0A1F6PFM0_9BACT|nr:MAG: hypothetical protein A2538_04590 [Candidatus Magasanikbacteria bacterium RIFOXYD2_FULL_41_14]